jgi:hypothetical protein
MTTMAIEREEFESWMNVLRSDIRGVHERLDGLNGRTRQAEQAIAVLQSQATKDPAARYSAIGAAAAALAGGIWTWLKG